MRLYISFLLLALTTNLSSQEFTFVEYVNSLSVGEIIHSDFDGDDKLDFITDSDAADRNFIGLNGDDYIFKVYNESINIQNIRAFDLDFDGDIDVIGSASREDRTILFINDGNANFEMLETSFPNYQGIDFADIDNDGISELILVIGDEIQIIKLPELILDFVITDEDTFFDPSYIKAHDYNQDGHMDIVVASSNNLVIFTQDSPQEFIMSEIEEEVRLPNEFFITDLNQDAIVDFVISGFEDVVLLSDDTGTYNKITIPFDNNYSWLNVADLDGDNIDELIFAEGFFLDESISILRFNSMTDSFEAENLISGLSNTRKGNVVDINNDGLEDIYFYSSGRFITGLQGAINLEDVDGDGFTNDIDCDDNNPNINPEADEICDGLDNNCNGQTDENQTFLSWWIDKDNDGYGEGPIDSSIVDCVQPVGYVQNYDDCNDNNPNINPEAEDIPNNGIDEDCDGEDLLSSIHQLSNSTISIYPNPVINGILNIDVEGKINITAKLFSLDGKLADTTTNNNQLILSPTSAGLYILEIRDLDTGQKILERLIIH